MHYNQAMKLRQKQSPTDAEALQEKVLLLQSQMQAQEIKINMMLTSCKKWYLLCNLKCKH